MSTETIPDLEAVAIVGLAGRYPGAHTIDELWKKLCDGVEAISFFSEEELIEAGVDPKVARDPNYVKARGVLGDTELFDAAFFGLNPREAALMDPQHRIFLECAWEALESAGYSPDHQPGRTGVFAGMSMNTYLLSNIYGHLAHVASVESLQASIGNDKDSLTTEVAYRLNLTGPAVTVQSSSSTSLTAIHYACQSLLSCECDMALAGGVSIHFPEKAGYMYYEGGTTSPDGHCRAFDEEARGFVAGHGAGVVVLRRLSDAIECGDTIYAVVRGSAVNNDGSMKVSYMAPSVEGQAEVIALAQAVAGVTPESIGYVEAHGTATPMGDPIELAALTQAFRAFTEKKGFCALGSIKSNIGHLDAAAGVTGFIKAALALYHKRIPPTLHFKRPNPALDLENSPFFINTRLMEFPRGESPRRAGVTSLGMGGTNAHCVLEEPPAPALAGPPRRRTELLLLSARSETALEAATSRLCAELEERPALDLADVVYTLKVGRKRFGHRRAIVCRGLEGAMAALAGSDPEHTFSGGEGQAIEGRPVMFLFSGQGAQHVDMGRGLYESEPVFQRELDACAEKLRPILGRDIRSVLYPKEDARERAAVELKETSLTQPALFVIGYALARLFLSWGIEPRAMLGHSIGEYVAACVAGVFELDDALSLVAARGRLMQKMPPGAMLAVSLPEAELSSMLGVDLSIAVINSQASSVVAGPLGAIDVLARELEGKGIAATRLLTSHAFHSAMMDPVLDAFRAEVARVERRPPQLPILSNVTGTWMTAEEATSPDYWARQLRAAVRFADGLGELLEEPDALVLELGPGQKLVALAAEHPKKGPSQVLLGAMRHPRAQQADDEHLSTVLGRMFLSGVEPNWSAFYDGEQRRRVALPTYPFERQRHWVEPRPSEKGGTSAPFSDQKLEVARWFYLPAWRRALAPQKGVWAREKACYWLFVPAAEEDRLSARMERRLVEAGHEVLTVALGERSVQTGERSWTMRPDDAHAYTALFERESAMGRAPDHIVHMWLASSNGEEGAALERGVHSLLLLAKAIARQKRTLRSLVVVAGQMQSLAGEQPCPEHAAMIGPCRVIQQEIPSIACRAVDIAWPLATSSDVDALVDRLLGEGVTVDPSLSVVAYRGLQRWVQAYEPFACPPVSEATPVRESGVYLVLGGLGQLGHCHARALARRGRAIRLVLAARSTLPGREAWDDWLAKEGPSDPTSRKIRKIRELEALGAEVLVRQADVSKEAELSALIRETLSRFGALHGVVFAAGTVDRSLFRGLLELQIEDVKAYFRVRADGLRALEAALGEHPLDFCMVASSLASVLGGLGLFGYSAATSFMDAFVERRAELAGTAWTSVSWDAWQPEEEDRAAPRGAKPFGDLAISEDEGEEAILRLLTMSGASHVAVSTSDLAARAARWARPELEEGADEGPRIEASREPRRAQSKAFVAPRDELESTIARLWESMLGIAEVGIHDNFFDVGGNSLVGVKLIARLREDLDISIPAVALYESPTVAALARMIRASRGDESGEARADADESQARGERRRARQSRRGGRASGEGEDS